MESSNKVNILHCGGAAELHCIEFLNQTIAACCNEVNKIDLQYTTYRENQTNGKETVMLANAQNYKKKNEQVILLVSKDFFQVMWSSPQKQVFLKTVTSIKNCLHIWLDVNEDHVNRHSNKLSRKDLGFTRILVDELNSGFRPSQNVERIAKLRSFLATSNSTKCNMLNNYAVDDEVGEMRRRFEQFCR